MWVVSKVSDASDLIGSRGRIRIIGILAEHGKLNIAEISRKSGMNYTDVIRHLNVLKNLGLIKEKQYVNERIFESLFKNLTICFKKGHNMMIEIENIT